MVKCCMHLLGGGKKGEEVEDEDENEDTTMKTNTFRKRRKGIDFIVTLI